MIRADVQPDMLRWARERAGLQRADLQRRFPKLESWERGEARPTLKQLERFARAVWAPVGYLFLAEPPVESVPIPDLRSGASRGERSSPNLLDTVYLCQARQAWYHDFARTAGEAPKSFVGSMTTATTVEDAAASIRDALGLDLEALRRCSTWTDALRQFIAQADALGILVLCSGVVLDNNRRKLDPGEFRGFAMADPLAPLVFINGANTKSAQMFTLAHELGHLWLGQSALTDPDPSRPTDGEVQTWCNGVAAELLVPLALLREELDSHEEETDTMSRFASSLIESTLEGRTLYRDAFRLLGISKVEAFNELARTLHPSV